ncbi:MAG: M48 family metalloprotease [Gemmatimonadaceae bacterium]
MTDEGLLNRIFGHGSGETAMKVRDITYITNQADVVLDPACKEIVQPFGVLDSAASLAVLAAKLELDRKLHAGPQTSPMALIRMAAVQLNWLPTSTERSIGARMLASSSEMILDEDHSSASKSTYAHARQTLAQVLAQIHEPLPYTFQIFVLKEKQENAASLPGGTILVDEDLFDRDWNPSVAFFKVAHEVSHVLQRHQTRMYQARLADGIATVQDLRKLVAKANNQPAEIVGRIIGLKHLMVEFTASQELQADACAVRLIRSHFAQADLGGMQHAIIESLGPVEPVAQDADTLLPQASKLVNGEFERHPNTSERRKNLDAMFASRG